MKIMGMCAVAFAVALAAGQRVEVETHRGGFEAHMARVASKGWASSELSGAHKATNRLEVMLAVRQSNKDELERRLLSVSDPRSPQYGRHLSQTEVDALVAPAQESLDAVEGWLHQHGIVVERATNNGDFLKAVVTVAQAEALLNTTYARFTHASGEAVTRAVRPYSLPASVAPHLDLVTPTITFPPLHRGPKRSGQVSAGACKAGGCVTPAFLRKLYNLQDSDVGSGNASNNTQAVASFIEQYYDPADLKAFWEKYPPPARTPYSDVGKQSHKADVEGSIDSEYISSTGAGVSTQMWYTAGTQPGNVENEPFVKWLTTVATTANAPNIFSISYGDDETGVTESYAKRASTEFQKAGARGISLLAASGDAGAGCAAGGYAPTWPGTDPYITAVGGLEGGGASGVGVTGTGETAAALSGGGFSNYFTRPSYQDAAVAAYKKNLLPAQKMWNADGAGFPDISAQALHYDTCSDNFFYPYDGTSCACPTVSGIFALLNEERLKAGKSVLGYLNPLLYTMLDGKGFNDVTEGNNNYCDQPDAFPATKGWDAVTGFGSPDFATLKGQVLSLP